MKASSKAPLAERLRPLSIEDYVGQSHLLAKGQALSSCVLGEGLHSMIFWGPPGTGKTTLAGLLAEQSGLQFIRLSAVLDGVKEVRLAVKQAQRQRQQFNQGTLLFVDEVHRFNKSQQDAFLPFVEDGTFIFIGATTENPSFALNNALLSRAQVYPLQALTESELQLVLQRGLRQVSQELGQDCQLMSEAEVLLLQAADGDARRLLNLLEQATRFCDQGPLTEGVIKRLLQAGVRRFDKGGEAFYDQASALHKSVRGSDPQAALYWLCRLLDGGADPLYLARRLIRMASEEVGNADPRALQVTVHAAQSYERLGSPEGELALAQAVTYLAVAPKSNAVYQAYKAAVNQVKQSPSYPVPLHLRNAPTTLMQQLDYGKGYRYAHDEPEAYAAGEDYFPEAMPPETFYQPVERGLEIKIAEKMRRLAQLDQASPIQRRLASRGRY